VTGVLIRREETDTDTGKRLEPCFYKPGNAWGCKELEEEGREGSQPLEMSEGAQPCQYFDFILLTSRTVRECFHHLKPRVFGTLF
jgi:hypothetical protein